MFTSRIRKISVPKIVESFGIWWRYKSHIIFSLLFFIVLGMSIFTWYQSLYVFHWDASQEREYRLTKNKQVKFQNEKFDSVLGALDDRSKEHDEPSRVYKDLFVKEVE